MEKGEPASRLKAAIYLRAGVLHMVPLLQNSLFSNKPEKNTNREGGKKKIGRWKEFHLADERRERKLKKVLQRR